VRTVSALLKFMLRKSRFQRMSRNCQQTSPQPAPRLAVSCEDTVLSKVQGACVRACALDTASSGQGTSARFCGQGNETSHTIKEGNQLTC
jgi:hypothetical protein